MLERHTIMALTLSVLVWASSGQAEERHHGAHRSDQPVEAGQAAFAALAEIVSILDADSRTDWTKVDISALQEHLVDMNVLTLNAVVAEEQLDDGLSITIMGEERTLEAIHHMVPAHATELDKMPNWSAWAETVPEGATLTVTSPDQAIQAKIRALGFFGLMATGSHHQAHHLAIARGQPDHGHR